MKRIALLTSGGDGAGMNACIRSVVRTAAARGIESVGVFRGYEGLIDGRFKLLRRTDVSGIINLGVQSLKLHVPRGSLRRPREPVPTIT